MTEPNEAWTFVELKDRVKIISTRSLRDARKGRVFAEIRTSAIPEAGFIPLEHLDDEDIKSISLNETDAKAGEKQTLIAFDVLLQVQGRTGNVGIMPAEIDNTYIAGQSSCILRSENKAQAIGLYVFLQSDFGQEQLRKLSSGGNIARISIKNLETMRVPDFNAEQLHKAQQQFEEEIQILSKIEALKKQMLNLRSNFY